MYLASGIWHLASGDLRLATGNLRLETGDWRLATGDFYHLPLAQSATLFTFVFLNRITITINKYNHGKRNNGY